MKHLCYARTILDKSTPKVRFENGKQETALICLSGELDVNVGAERFNLGERDSVYIPRDSSIQLETRSSADVAEFSADVDNKYPLQIVRYADVKQDKSLHFTAGGAATTRDLNILFSQLQFHVHGPFDGIRSIWSNFPEPKLPVHGNGIFHEWFNGVEAHLLVSDIPRL